jgi:heme exporter protein A
MMDLPCATSLCVEQLSYSLANNPIFCNLSFRANVKEIWRITGANGTGKTTFLKCLAGIYPTKNGTIQWPSIAESAQPIEPNLFSNRLYIGHELAIKPNLTVYETVQFWAELMGFPELTMAALHYWSLTPYAHYPCRHLSAGWKKRVQLSRLLLNPLSVLWLLDETDTNLDQHAIKQLVHLMQLHRDQGGIILFTSHHGLPIAHQEWDLSDHSPQHNKNELIYDQRHY